MIHGITKSAKNHKGQRSESQKKEFPLCGSSWLFALFVIPRSLIDDPITSPPRLAINSSPI